MLTADRLNEIRKWYNKAREGRTFDENVGALIDEVLRLRAALADKPGAGLVVGQRYRLGDLPLGAEYQQETASGVPIPGHTWKVSARGPGIDDAVRTLVSPPPQSTPADAQPAQMTEGLFVKRTVEEVLTDTHCYHGLPIDKRTYCGMCSELQATQYAPVRAAIKGGDQK